MPDLKSPLYSPLVNGPSAQGRAVGRPAGPFVRGDENRKTQQKYLFMFCVLLRVAAMKRTVMRNRTKILIQKWNRR